MTDQTTIEPKSEAKPRRLSGIAGLVMIGIGAWATLIGTVVYFVFWATSGIVDTAGEFFADIHQKDSAGAYELASTGFMAQTDIKAFERFVAAYKLNRYDSQSWSSRETSGIGDGATGKLEGSLLQKDGAALPLTVSLIKETGQWRILAIDLIEAGTKTANTPDTVPKQRDLLTLAHNSDIAFAQSVAAGSMDKFHNYISKRWASQHSTEQLQGFYKAFLQSDIDLLPVRSATPVLARKSNIDDDGVLIVKGTYAMGTNRSEFSHKYIYEDSAWKLIGYSLDFNQVARVDKKLSKFRSDPVERK